MPTAAQVLTDLAKRAGIDTKPIEEAVKENEALGKVELPDATINQLKENLITTAQARENREIKNFFKGQFLSSADSKVKEVAEAMGVEGDALKTVLAGEGTNSKIELMAAAVRELEAAKAQAAGGDKKVLTDEINDLNKQIKKARKDGESAVTKLTNKYEGQINDMVYHNSFTDVAYTTAFPRNVAIEAAKSMVRDKAAEIGAKVVIRDGRPALVDQKDDSLPFKRQNDDLTFNTLRDEVIAEGKLNQTATPAAAANPTPAGGQATPPQQTDLQRNATDMLKRMRADQQNGNPMHQPTQ